MFSLDQTFRVLKEYWAQTIRVGHVVVAEVATRIHTEHVSITAIPVIRRHTHKVADSPYFNYTQRYL